MQQELCSRAKILPVLFLVEALTTRQRKRECKKPKKFTRRTARFSVLDGVKEAAFFGRHIMQLQRRVSQWVHCQPSI